MREKAYTQKEKLGCYLNELHLTLVGSTADSRCTARRTVTACSDILESP